MRKNEKPHGKEVYIDSNSYADDLIGKYVYNPYHCYGGIIIDIDDRSITLQLNISSILVTGVVETTITGDCPFDSITINGFEIYEPE